MLVYIKGENKMDKDNQEHKKFLEEQLQWCKEQDNMLRELDMKLHEMKEIAISVIVNNLSPTEYEALNERFNKLKIQVNALEQQLHTIVN